ncbi:MAG TPA: HAMP domain-containing sensor histidine kinase [Solirubrobacteraceae bacterium]|nr:HAMP domain-containing sensor histidine kinase [Solirubrobacteraceae bacterium]
MSLRLRIAGVAGLAVALAVLAAAIGLYLAVRSDLRGQVDESLKQRTHVLVARRAPRAGAPGDAGALLAGGAIPPGSDARRVGRALLPQHIQPARFGGASGYVQFISHTGTIIVPGGQGSTPKITPDAREKAIAASGHGSELSDRTVKGTHLRVLTIGVSESSRIVAAATGAATATGTTTSGDGAAAQGGAGASTAGSGATGKGGVVRGAVMTALPLTEVDHELSHILLILVLVGVCGIALAALLGALVARTALAPIVRFTRRTESLAGELNLSERLDVNGRDELSRLARSFNTTLAALEAALAAQRQLIADASHELRTPIATLRANIQILEDAERLPPDEQRRLHADIVSELDELTALVGDVVELARGARADEELSDVRLDEIVGDAVAVARRRGELRFELELQPTLVRGEGARISRAVSNLLDNARKWSPPDGAVDVVLRDGVLSVRDHGPGFGEQDLSRVFERFYRSERARKLPGSGLGLAIVRQAAEAHGGYARATNAADGGARLEVSFGPHTLLALDSEPLSV